MAVVLDTDQFDERDRADALREAMRVAGVPASVTPLRTPEVRTRLSLWELDRQGSTLMHRIGTGVHLERTARQVRAAAPDRIGLTLLSTRNWTFHQFRADHAAADRPTLVLVNQGAPYLHRRWDYGVTLAVNMDRAVLDVPMDLVVRASQNLAPTSPLHDLICGYLTHLHAVAVHTPSALPHLALSTVQLARSMIYATADDDRQADALADSLLDRIKLYALAHLSDPELGADLIAAAHHISVRQLYNVWRDQETSLANWILSRRLERARDRLTDPSAAHLTIAAVGRSCGFLDPTHFGRRFRLTYGVTPRDFRVAAAARRAADTLPDRAR